MRREKAARAFGGYRASGLTLVETVAVAGVLGAVLVAAAAGTRYVRDELKTTQTLEMLARLDEAVRAYYQATGTWPGVGKMERGRDGETGRRKAEGSGFGGSYQGSEFRTSYQGSGFRVQDQERAAVEVLGELRRVTVSGEMIERLARDLPGAMGEQSLRDSWGHNLRCLTADSVWEADRRAVAAHGGEPIFVSDGPGGKGADELRSDELPR